MAGEKAVLANKPRNLIPMDTKQTGKYTTQNELRFIKGTGGEQNGNTYYRCFDWPDSSRHCTEQRPERPGLLDLWCSAFHYGALLFIVALPHGPSALADGVVTRICPQ